MTEFSKRNSKHEEVHRNSLLYFYQVLETLNMEVWENSKKAVKTCACWLVFPHYFSFSIDVSIGQLSYSLSISILQQLTRVQPESTITDRKRANNLILF